MRAWRYFHRSVEELAENDAEVVLPRLFAAIADQLCLVVITIDRENPYEIFESLNSTGLPLEESDLIRNYLFMRVNLDEQEDFNAACWRPFETMFDEKDEHPAISATDFYRDYLMRTGTYVKKNATFVDFKATNKQSGLTPEKQVADLKRHAKYELILRRPGTCKDEDLGKALSDIVMLEIKTAYPLLMHLMSRHDNDEIADEALLGCLADLASFVLRRSVCGESTRQYARWFPEAIKAIRTEPREDLRRHWLERGWPDDETFIARLEDFALYRRESKKCWMILESLEAFYGHKEKVERDPLTIEHVLPRKIDNGKAGQTWQVALGENWHDLHQTWIHTLGNLTLTAYNPELSNRPYDEKQAKLKESNLVLNDYFGDIGTWDVEAIRTRGRALAADVAKLWPRPSGGTYVPPQQVKKSSLAGEELRELRHDYWCAFADVLPA